MTPEEQLFFEKRFLRASGWNKFWAGYALGILSALVCLGFLLLAQNLRMK